MKKLLLLIGFSLFSSLFALKVEIPVISNDKTMIALAFDDDVIRLYSLKTGKLLQELKAHKGSIQTISFNSDGTKLISGDWQEAVIIWDTKTGKIEHRKKAVETIMHAYFSPNDETILLSVDEQKVALYDNQLKKEIKTFEMDQRLKISDNKKIVAGESFNQSVEVINLATQEVIMNIPKVDVYDDEMYITPDDSTVIIRDYSNFHVWDIKNKKAIDTINSSIGADTANINPATNELWIANNNSIEIWNYKTPKQKAIIRLLELDIDQINQLTFSKDGKTLAITVSTESSGSKAIVLDTASYTIKSQIKTISNMVYGTTFINNDQLLLHSLYPIEIWDIKSKQKLLSLTKTGSNTQLSMVDIIKMEALPFSTEGDINGLDVNPAGNIILTGTGSNANRELDSKGNIIQVFQNKYSTGYDARYSPDGTLAAFAYHGEHLLIYNVKTKTLNKEYDLGNVPNGTRIIKFSRDGKFLAAGSDGNKLSIIDIDKKEVIDEIKFPAGIFSLQWIDNKNILVGTLLELYELNLKSKQKKTILEFGVTALDAYFDGDNIELIAVGGHQDNITLLDKNRKKLRTLPHTEVIRVTISKDGKQLVSSSESDTYVWDLATGKSKTCAFEDENIWAMAYDKERQRIYTAGDFGKINVWDNSCNEITSK